VVAAAYFDRLFRSLGTQAEVIDESRKRAVRCSPWTSVA